MINQIHSRQLHIAMYITTTILFGLVTPAYGQYMDECRFQNGGSYGLVLSHTASFRPANQTPKAMKLPLLAYSCTPNSNCAPDNMKEAHYARTIEKLDSALKSDAKKDLHKQKLALAFYKQGVEPSISSTKKLSLLRMSLYLDPGNQSSRKALEAALLEEKNDRLTHIEKRHGQENAPLETEIEGFNTAGTVRTGTIANIEAMLNLIANGLQTLGIAWGGPTIIFGFMRISCMLSVYDKSKNKWVPGKDGIKRVIFGVLGVLGALAVPGIMNWLVSSAHNAGLFG